MVLWPSTTPAPSTAASIAYQCGGASNCGFGSEQAAHQPEPMREIDRPTRPSRPSARIDYRVSSSGHIQGAHRPNGHLTSNLHDAADHTAIIDARFASRVGRQMRLDLRKLRFRQPKLVATHLCLLFGSRESRHYVRANTFMGPDPRASPRR